MYLSTDEFPTRSAVLTHLETLCIDSGHPLSSLGPKKFGEVLDRYVDDKRLLKIRDLRPGQVNMNREDLSYTTALAYLSMIKRIRERWGETAIGEVKPYIVSQWLKNMTGAPKTKGNIKALMHRVFEKAMLWEEFEFGRNPMELVEVSFRSIPSSRRFFINCSGARMDQSWFSPSRPQDVTSMPHRSSRIIFALRDGVSLLVPSVEPNLANTA